MFEEYANAIIGTLNNLPDQKTKDLNNAIAVARKMATAANELQIGGGNTSTLNTLAKLEGEINKLGGSGLEIASAKIGKLIAYINIYLDRMTSSETKLSELKVQLESLKTGLRKKSAKV